jgi:hypothetical protein
MYELTFDLPNAGLDVVESKILPAEPTFGDDQDNTVVVPVVAADSEPEQRYPTQSRWSVIGHQLYDTYATRTTFLQLGTTRVHRSVIEASRLVKMTKAEWLLATTTTDATWDMIDNIVHVFDPKLTTQSEDKIKVWGYLMTQYNLKLFRQRGADAAVKELTQLHVMDNWTAMDPTKLKQEERMQALLSLLFLMEKQTGTIKGGLALMGRHNARSLQKKTQHHQRSQLNQPSLQHQLQLRIVRCYNVPSMFRNTDVDKDVLMVLKGELVEMMVQIAPQIYQKFITMDKKGTKRLYVKLQKVLYGLMRESLLFYRKPRKEFEDYGLVVNLYDPCVANMAARNGSQLTAVWHIDNLMV